MTRLLCPPLFAVLLGLGLASEYVAGQEEGASERSQALANTDFETGEPGSLDGWRFSSTSDAELAFDFDERRSGTRSVVIDATESPESAARLFSNLSQVVDGRPYRGKRVRFMAAVKTAEFEAETTANLWFRVDRQSEQPPYPVGAFDNMDDRPILAEQWADYEIVLDVDEDAKQIIVGMFVQGKGKAWIDATSFEIVGQEIETTRERSEVDEDETQGSPYQMPASVMRAFQNAESAPRQPFWNRWLWLVAITLCLFGFGAIRTATVSDGQRPSPVQRMVAPLARFGFRFSFAYWVLYNFPQPLSGLLPSWGAAIAGWFGHYRDQLVSWTASHWFGILDELVPPNGSGDTTSSYLTILVFFVVAMAIALLWSLMAAFRRGKEPVILKDLLRSYLRYVLAFWMLTYGLSKVAFVFNQFPMVSEYQFNKTWGNSSPMNVVWSMMGASRPYTIFAGLGEVLAAFLLVWRHTAVLGSLVTIGVMTNVMMLNYCYDVPVKIFSTHLLAMAFCVLLPDAGRLLNLFVLNGNVPSVEMQPPYTNRKTIWVQRVAKVVVIVFLIVVPTYKHAVEQGEYLAAKNNQPDFFGQYEVVEFKLDGAEHRDEQHEWFSVRFAIQGDYSSGAPQLKNKMNVGFKERVGMVSVNFEFDPEQQQLLFARHQASLMPSETAQLEPQSNGDLVLSGDSARGRIEARLRRNANLHRLTGRGFRWINEVPFNR